MSTGKSSNAKTVDVGKEVTNGTETVDPSPEKTKEKRIRRIDEYYDFRTYSWKHRPSQKPERERRRKEIIVVRRRIDTKGRHYETVVDIFSPFVQDVMLDINKDVQGSRLKRSPPVANSELFFHSLGALQEHLTEEEKSDDPSSEKIEHLSIIVDWVVQEHADTFASTKSLFAANQVSWNFLWALFKPNSLVYHFHELTNQHQILLARRTFERIKNNVRYVVVACDIVIDNGIAFGYGKKEFELQQFEGTSRIPDLEVYPLNYHDDKDKHLKHVVARGSRYAALTGPTYQNVSGSAMREIRSTRHEPRDVAFFSHGRMIIDPKAFRMFEPNATYNLPVHQSLDRTTLNADQLAICSPIMLGYCFGAKQWGGFAIDRCEDVVWRNNAFSSLVLEEPKKRLLRALFKQHSRRKETFDDIVPGKGKGLIGLLAGSPGCGKTLTAESMSDLTRKPLYSVSAGELGTTPKDVDEKLDMILSLAVTWDAIVLMDEAEVFLQTRDLTSIERNALVSIFLRQLEYFEGIMILTTNRKADIDHAFKSRITFSFDYPGLNQDARAKVWKELWARVAGQQNPTEILDDNAVASLAKHEINGRDIKNTIAKALCIALDEGVSLSKRHVDLVLEEEA